MDQTDPPAPQPETDPAEAGDACLVLTSFSEALSARQFGTRLVEKQLAACVSLLPGVEAIYRWKSDVEVEGECLVIVKTLRGRLPALREFFAAHHPYEEPEFIVLPVAEGSPGYLAWLRASASGQP